MDRPEKRIAILGTAPTWRDCPWDDPTLEVWALNDAHVLHLPRADRWFDIHPIAEMYFHDRSQALHAGDVPAGKFVRPVGHLEWLRSQTIPVYLHDAADAARIGTPTARAFPREAIEAKFGSNFMSSPAWMIGLALLEGVTELHIYGIHLATEWEYLKQKPNMTFLLGLAAGLGVKVVLPRGCPLLKESHRYAYEPDPEIPKRQAERRVQALIAQRDQITRLPRPKWYQRADQNRASRLAWLTAQITDAKLGVMHVTAGQTPAGL